MLMNMMIELGRHGEFVSELTVQDCEGGVKFVGAGKTFPELEDDLFRQVAMMMNHKKLPKSLLIALKEFGKTPEIFRRNVRNLVAE